MCVIVCKTVFLSLGLGFVCVVCRVRQQVVADYIPKLAPAREERGRGAPSPTIALRLRAGMPPLSGGSSSAAEAAHSNKPLVHTSGSCVPCTMYHVRRPLLDLYHTMSCPHPVLFV